jgi:hypothetical protein
VIAASGPTPLWYAARSTGYVSLLLLTAILVLGVVTSMRAGSRRWPRFLSQALHRNLSLLVLVFLLVHIVVSVVDPFAGIAWLNVVAPFTGSYRPIWLGIGVVSTELLAALVITSLLRHRVGFTAWRVIHWAAYACWPLAMLHTLGTGSDVRSGWAVAASLLSLGAVLAALAWRLLDGRTVSAPLRVAGVGVTLAATIALVGFAAAGPLRAGWARAAGTPDSILAATTPAASPSPPAVASPVLTAGLNDTLAGDAIQSGSTVVVRLSDARDTNLHITISADNSAASRLTINEGSVPICDVGTTGLQSVSATCGTVAVTIDLAQQADGSITGQLVTRAAAG